MIFGYFLKQQKKKKTEKKKHNERVIKDRTIKDIKRPFQQEEDHYKPGRVSNFWNNYIEYESNGVKKRKLSLDECLNKIECYLKNIIIGPQNSNAWKVQVQIEINFTFSKDDEEERVMPSNSDKNYTIR